MRNYLLIALFSICTCTFAQTVKDTADIGFAVTAYPFSYSASFDKGTMAVGPSVFLNNSGRFVVQLGLLYDLRKYTFYNHVAHTKTDLVTWFNLFPLLLFHQHYSINSKISAFLTAGFNFGRTYYYHEGIEQTGTVNFIGGAGILYKPLRRLHLRVQPMMRYSRRHFFPGMLIDIVAPFKFEITRQE